MANAARRECSPLNVWEQRGRVVAGSLFVAAVAWSFWGTIGKPDCQDMDFGAYYRAAIATGRGESPYTRDEESHSFPPHAQPAPGCPPAGVFPYPPAYAYLLSPLRFLPYLWACRAWMLLNWLAVLAAVALSLNLALGQRRTPRETWGVLLWTVVPMAPYLWTCLRLGQIAMLMVLGCLGWAWLQRRGRHFLGGLLLAAAGALKLAPFALVPYLILQRDWRGLAGVALGLLLLFLLPTAWVGWDGTLGLHQEWVRHTALTDVPAQTYRPGNQSLLGMLARLPPVSDGHALFAAENLAALKRAYPAVLAALAACLYGWIYWRRRSLAANASAKVAKARDRVHLAMLFAFLTLAHPHAWRCNYVGLLLPCALLGAQVWHRRRGFGLSLAALALVCVACAWPTDNVGTTGWSLGPWLLLGKHFWAGLAVTVACCWSSRHLRAVDASSLFS